MSDAAENAAHELGRLAQASEDQATQLAALVARMDSHYRDCPLIKQVTDTLMEIKADVKEHNRMLWKAAGIATATAFTVSLLVGVGVALWAR